MRNLSSADWLNTVSRNAAAGLFDDDTTLTEGLNLKLAFLQGLLPSVASATKSLPLCVAMKSAEWPCVLDWVGDAWRPSTRV